MSAKKMHKIDEFVDSDGGMIRGNDRNPTSDSEIETGPTPKTWDDDSDYEKGMSTTTDRATRYRQNIPWFAVYSYGGTHAASGLKAFESVKLTKNTLEEKIDDLVKKGDYLDLTSKNDNIKLKKIIQQLRDIELTDDQKDEIKKTIEK